MERSLLTKHCDPSLAAALERHPTIIKRGFQFVAWTSLHHFLLLGTDGRTHACHAYVGEGQAIEIHCWGASTPLEAVPLVLLPNV